MTDLKQIQRFNLQSPLCKLAERLLLQLQADPDQSGLYPLQLCLEILEEHTEELPPLLRDQRSVLRNLLAAASLGPPQRAIGLLVNRDRQMSLQEAADRLANRLEDKKPVEAALELLENFRLNAAKGNPALYGPVTDPR